MLLKKILITGASKGIGREIARVCLEAGFRVYGTSRNPYEIKDPLPGIRMVRLEITDPESIEACYREVGEIDILVNNIGQSKLGPLEEIPVNKFREMFEINLFGQVHLTQLFLHGMRERHRGMIINIGSLSGRFSLPFQSAYSASKAAVRSYTQCLRQELKDQGIRVVLVEPSDIRTTITPEYICEEDSSFIVNVDKVREHIRQKMMMADPPELVAKKVIDIIYKKRLRQSYAVGGRSPVLVFLQRFIPQRMEERLIRNSYGLKFKRPMKN
jgi:short-subunit dehydrogenase